MYGQYFVMPRNVVLSVEEEEIFENGGGLAKKTLYDRKRECDYFYSFFKEESSEQLEDLIKTEEDRDKISKILSKFFWSMHVKEGTRPKKNYATKMRSNIKNQVLIDYKFDILDNVMFPNTERRWTSFCHKLAEEGLSGTKHFEEVPAKTMEKIYDLLWSVKEALENRGDKDYVSKYLNKIPSNLHNQLH